MPDFNYQYTINALNLEIYGIDQNYVDVGGIGGDAGGHAQRNAVCGGEGQLSSRLQTVGHSGEALLAWGAERGAHNATQTRNVLILQHYPGLCAGLKKDFVSAAPEPEDKLDVRCAFGHTHETICESGTDPDCAFSMVGGGGGCCDGDVTNGGAGFGVLHFLPEVRAEHAWVTATNAAH